MKAYRTYRLLCMCLSFVLFLMAIPLGMGVAPSTAGAASGTDAPVNARASAEAAELLEYLYSISGKATITGQHDYLESPDEFNNKLKATSGKYAALHGYELGAISGQSSAAVAWYRQNVVNSAIKWSNNGGMVTMTYHANLPGTSYNWSNVSRSLSQTEFNKYVTPGTVQYNQLIAELDKVAVSLKSLRDAGVPVLWRPYHEMNGNWFWWGKKNNFSTLWNIMYDRFVNVHQLNNLLWVWSPNAPNAWADPYALTYPGADKVDILAADIYENDYRQSYYDSLVSLAGNKPIAIGENGEMPDPNKVLQKQNRWVYMMNWGKMLYENNSNTTIKNFMNSDVTLTREDYKSGIIPSAAPTVKPAPTVTPTPTAKPTAKPTAIPTTTPVVSKPTPSPTPDDNNGIELPLVNGLKGEYYSNAKLSGAAAVTRKDNVIDFNWRQGTPDPALGVNYFSVRWSGKIKPLYTETYNIYTTSDDGIRVWVNGQPVIDSWAKQSGTERMGSIALKGGQLADIKVEYYENEGDARVRLLWESSSQVKSMVPSSALFLNPLSASEDAAALPVVEIAAPTAVNEATPVPTATPAATNEATPVPVPTPTAAIEITPSPDVTSVPMPVPLPEIIVEPADPQPVLSGLQAEYFNNMQLSGEPEVRRTDVQLDFNWRLTSPDESKLGADFFSVRWSGRIKPLYSETYQIYTTSDDGIRVWIDGNLIIDSWVKQSGTERQGSISLDAGQLYDIKVEYYENQGDARARLMWESPSQSKETVPGSALFLP
ncbi:PA14 domain-containing protein [Paenibacillus albidus]|uniref:PA14 domain-containing protein n=1 Tax=Paenibacillus albidus TaxID=2041023 RepID=UPI002034A9EC|nr:PA14 domain-containing protein [Paenibacillus albidus]